MGASSTPILLTTMLLRINSVPYAAVDRSAPLLVLVVVVVVVVAVVVVVVVVVVLLLLLLLQYGST